MRLLEARPVGAETVLLVDQCGDHVVPLQRGWRQRPAGYLCLQGVTGREPGLIGFGLPTLSEVFRCERPVLGRASRQGSRVVGPHPHGRAWVLGAGARQVLFDGHRPLGERPEPSVLEPFDLPASVAVRSPCHPEPLGESAP